MTLLTRRLLTAEECSEVAKKRIKFGVGGPSLSSPVNKTCRGCAGSHSSTGGTSLVPRLSTINSAGDGPGDEASLKDTPTLILIYRIEKRHITNHLNN